MALYSSSLSFAATPYFQVISVQGVNYVITDVFNISEFLNDYL